MDDFNQPKLMYSEIVREPQFFLDKFGEFLPEASTFLMTGENIDYLYKVFHTRIVTYFFKKFYAGGGLGGDGYRYKKAFFEQLPIPKLPKAALEQFKCLETENEIEEKVIQLFGLSNIQIQFIESQYSQ